MVINVYILALAANICFALGSQVYTHFSRTVSAVWMNCVKAIIAGLAFAITICIWGQWHSIPAIYLGLLLASGFIGLGIGDVFLLKSFSLMGPGRTLLIFGFQPLLIGIMSYFVFDQTVDAKKFWAILFFILCLAVFSLESYKKSGHWEFKGIAMAITGMTLDAIGIIFTRYSFDKNPELDAMEGNFYRCLGAILVFLILSKIRPFKLIERSRQLNRRSVILLIVGSLLGTYFSLGLYLKAIQSAHLASLSALAITGTMFATLFECIWEKKLISKYMLLAIIFFLAGMNFLLF
jgi:drug/metabolite transporter (DMT)-like permease